jgi:predicted dehydrogenase
MMTASAGALAAVARADEAKPFRIGMVGSQNSHAQAYSDLINLKDAGKTYGNVRVTHIWGEEDAKTKEVAEKCAIPNIVKNHTDMLGHVDGVICVRRHGGKHLEDALPFLQAKIPAYVDKPLACSVADARAMIAAAQASGVGFSSFSTLRFAPETEEFVAALRAEAGELRAGTSAGHCEPESEYGGIFFYGIHAVELMTATWGYGVESVVAMKHGPNVSAFCAYKNGATVSLELLGDAKYVFHLTAFGTKAWKTVEVGTGNAYAAGMKTILATLIEQAWPIDAVHLVEPIQILSAVELSVKENRKVALSELG